MRIKTICGFCAASVSALFLCSCLSWFRETPPLPEKEPNPEPTVIESTAPGLVDKWAAPGEPAPHIPEAATKADIEKTRDRAVKESSLESENGRISLRPAPRARSRANLNARTAPPATQTPRASRPGSREADYRKVVARALLKEWAASPEAATQRRLSRDRKTGRVELVLHLTPDGRVAAAAVRKSSGSTEKDRAILRAARSLKKLPPPPSGAGPVHLALDI